MLRDEVMLEFVLYVRICMCVYTSYAAISYVMYIILLLSNCCAFVQTNVKQKEQMQNKCKTNVKQMKNKKTMKKQKTNVHHTLRSTA